MINNLLEKIKKSFEPSKKFHYQIRNNGNAAFNYEFMMSLDEKDYPKYLKQAYYMKTGYKLNLRNPKTFNEKIQWLKVYDNIPIKTTLTDKVLVRNWVKEKIGEEYLKPVLWIGDKFDDIPFDFLPEPFIVKTNHGCKWCIIVKDKNEFVNNEKLYQYSKSQFDGWLNQSFYGWSDFETQYRNIKPKIIIERLLRDNINRQPLEYEIYCFNGTAKILQKYKYNDEHTYRLMSSYDEDFNSINIKFLNNDVIQEGNCDDNLKHAAYLSEQLSKDFKLVRVDWLVHNNKLYFGEMTFTPYSGFINFSENDYELHIKLGKMLNLKGV